MLGLHNVFGRGSAMGALGVVALIAVACGGDDDSAGGFPSSAQPEATATTVAAAPTTAPAAGTGFGGAASYEGSGGFDWAVTRVDGGTKPDVVVTSEGGVAVAYMLERRGAAGYVRVATLDGDGFAIETLQDGYLYGPLDLAARPDGALAVGCHNHDWEDAGVAVLDADDRPHVAFIQSDTTLREEGRNAGNVVYGMFDGTAWSFEQLATLDSMVLDFEVRGAPWRSRSPRTGR